jgi:hypothetical protein
MDGLTRKGAQHWDTPSREDRGTRMRSQRQPQQGISQKARTVVLRVGVELRPVRARRYDHVACQCNDTENGSARQRLLLERQPGAEDDGLRRTTPAARTPTGHANLANRIKSRQQTLKQQRHDTSITVTANNSEQQGSAPGAMSSGLSRSSNVGPREENPAPFIIECLHAQVPSRTKCELNRDTQRKTQADRD